MPITKDSETKTTTSATTTKSKDSAPRDNKSELPTTIDNTDFPGPGTTGGGDSGTGTGS